MEKEDLEFMSELKAATLMRPSFASNFFLFAIMALIVCVVLWAAIAEVEERVHGNGQIIPSSETQTIQSLEGGILAELLVREGDSVKKDQLLARIDDVFFASEERGTESQLLSLQAKKIRIQAEASGKEFSMPEEIAKKIPAIAQNEKKLYESRKSELQSSLDILKNEAKEAEHNIGEVRASIDKLTKSRALISKELEIAKRLSAAGAMPEIEKLKLEREHNEISGNLETARKSLGALQAKMDGVKQKQEERINAFRSQALGELNDVETRISSMKETLNSMGDRVNRTELKAPADGIVQRIAVKTIGGVIEPAQKLIEIVPVNDELVVRAKISPKDVAFLKPGQAVKVNVSAYEPQIYGSLKGTLERIGADTIKDAEGNVFFEIEVHTEKNFLGSPQAPLRIIPGMVAETEVITGKRTILTYMLKPVLRARNRALSER